MEENNSNNNNNYNNDNNTNKNNYQIITHAGCTDGFFSAWITRRFFNELTGLNLSREKINNIEVIGVNPADMQIGEIPLTKFDIILDLPLPEGAKVFLWVDHHASSRPKRDLDKSEHWEMLPSCTGQLISLIKENGFDISEELLEFKKAIDKIDSADYTEAEIKKTYYQHEDYDTSDALLCAHILSSFVHTKDMFLNDTFLKNLTKADENSISPLSDKNLWQVMPVLFHEARMQGHIEWREQVDTYMEFKETSKTIIQDSRKIYRTKGIVDRFYQYIKFPKASYAIIIKDKDEDSVYLGVGCNIFHKERCKVDIGKICKDVATRFGIGGGGGHKTVGGCVINKEHTDEAVAKILDSFQEAE